jgi:iron complex transport system ATP-binding protein
MEAMIAPGIITLSELEFGYEPQQSVLQSLSLEIPPGSITAILGPNGAGKTTLLYILLGLLTPRSGVVRIDGKPQTGLSRRAMSRLIGLVPQGEYLPFDFPVLDYVLLGRAPYLGPLEMPSAADRQVALKALATVGLTHLQSRPVPTLSGGEIQLAMVARALTQNPRILLLDEPTSHLDLGNRGRVSSVLGQLARDNVTVVFTTHDPNLVAAMADYTVLLHRGAVLAAGAMRETMTSGNLTSTYGIPVQVTSWDGRLMVVS